MITCKNNVFFTSYGFLMMMMFLSLQVSSSTDTTISNNQSLSRYQTIVSSTRGYVLELHLSTPATMFRESSNKFLPLGNMESGTKPEPVPTATTRRTTCQCFSDLKDYLYPLYDNKKCPLCIYDDLASSYAFLTANGLIMMLQSKSSRLVHGEMIPMHSENGDTTIKYYKVITIVLASVLTSVTAAAFLVGSCCYFSSRRRRRAHKDETEDTEDETEDSEEEMCDLSLDTIITATNAFSEDHKLGEGGFGPVYKGKLPNGKDVAIKRLSKRSSQGLVEFKNEVRLVNKLQHKNLVRLLGYCVEEDEKLLIYEYISNKSLDAFLFAPLKCRELNWENRMKIINGTIKGIQYLHEDSRLKIIHRDLKASNILLDDELNPKISDFGTARIFGCKQSDDRTERIVGTFGYMSPEYALNGMISEKSDIYSFGVLLLEIISGKKANKFVHNNQKQSLIAYAWQSWCDTKGLSIIDEALGDSYTSKEAMRYIHAALLSVQDHPNDRPAISRIVYMLSNDHHLHHPKQPTFTNVLNCDQRLLYDRVFSINEMTQTTIEGR